MAIKITCIKKDDGNHENPFIAISSMEWINDADNTKGNSTRLAVYDFVKKGSVAYVKDDLGNKANLIACETEKGTKYVKTKADTTTSDNLLKLPECK